MQLGTLPVASALLAIDSMHASEHDSVMDSDNSDISQPMRSLRGSLPTDSGCRP